MRFSVDNIENDFKMRNIHVKMLTIPSSFPSSETQILHEQLQERSLLSTQVCLELVLWHKCEPELMLVHTGPFVVHQFALFSLHPFSSAIPSNHYDVQPLFFRLFSPCFHFPIIESRKCCWQANLHKNKNSVGISKSPHYLAVWTVRRRTGDHLHRDQYVYLLVPPA